MREQVSKIHTISWRWLVGGGLVLFMAIYWSGFFSYGFTHGDEGYAVMGGWRIALGEVPHADYLEALPPFSFLPTALFLSLFGASFLTLRCLVVLYALLLIFACDRLLKNLSCRPGVRVALICWLVPFGVFFWPLPSHHWTIAIVQLLSLSVLLDGLKSSPARNGFIAGCLVALGCFSMQDQGGYLLISLLFLFFPWISDRDKRKHLFVAWWGGIITTGGVFAIYLLPRISLSELFFQWFTFPLTSYTSLAGNVGSLEKLGLQQIGTAPWFETLRSYPEYTLSQTLFSVLLPLFPVVAIGVLTLVFCKKRAQREITGLLLAGVLAFLGGCLHRYSQTYLVWAAPMFLVAIFWGLSCGRTSQGRMKWAAWTLIVLSLTYSLGNWRLKLLNPTVEVRGRAGTLIVPARSAQSSMQLVIDAIEQHVPEDAPLFVSQYNLLINFWVQRKNPLPYNFYIPGGIYDEGQIADLVGALKENPETHVLLFAPIDPTEPLAHYVMQNYRIVWRAPWALLMAPRR